MAENISPFIQKEALCLMWYVCGKCGKRERIWNSRPRVALLIVGCPDCGGKMQHTDWSLDEYAPNHIPKKGDRIFVDWSREACEKFRMEYIEKYWENGSYPMKDRTDLWSSKEESLAFFMDSWEFGTPVIEIV